MRDEKVRGKFDEKELKHFMDENPVTNALGRCVLGILSINF